jgi:hypothetical protein
VSQRIVIPPGFHEVLKEHPRVAIAGGPRCGKTTLAEHVRDMVGDRAVFLHDYFKQFEWSVVPHAMIAATKDLTRFCIEGVNVARALRKGMSVDAVVYLHKPRLERTKGQITMAKGVHTVFKQWRAASPETPLFVLE